MSIIEPWYLVQVHPIRVRHLWWRLDRGSPFAYRIIAPPQKDRFLFCKNRGATRQPFLRTLAFSLERLFLFFFSFWVSSFCTARRFNFDQGFQRSRSEASLFVHCVNMMSSGFSLSIGRNFTSNFYKRVRRKITNHSSFRHASHKILLSFRD